MVKLAFAFLGSITAGVGLWLNWLLLFGKHDGGIGTLIKSAFIRFVENKSAGSRLSTCPLPLDACAPPQSELCDTLKGRTRGGLPQGGEAAYARFGCAETRGVRRAQPHNCGVLESGKGQSMEKAAARKRFEFLANIAAYKGNSVSPKSYSSCFLSPSAT